MSAERTGCRQLLKQGASGLWLALGVALSGCGEGREAPVVTVQVTVEQDSGDPLPGARVLLGGSPGGTSDALGRWQGHHVATPGQSRLSVSVKCPEGHRILTPGRHLPLDGRGAGGTEVDFQLRFVCAADFREVALLVRAPGAEGAAIYSGGVRVGEVGPSGASHLLLKVPAGESFRVSLDTSQHPRLRPQNPAREFEAEGQSSLMVFDQRFEFVSRRPVSRRRGRGPGPKSPRAYRLSRR